MNSKWKEKFENLDKSIAELNKKAEAIREDAGAARELRKEVIDDKIGNLRGDVEAMKENIRIAEEDNKRKLSSALLKAQMTTESKIQEMKDAKDRKKLEKYIERRMDYAEDCFVSAVFLMEDAQLSLLEALAAADEYDERFGEDNAG